LDPMKNSPAFRARPLPRPSGFCPLEGAVLSLRSELGTGLGAGESPRILRGGKLCLLAEPLNRLGLATLLRVGVGPRILLTSCIGVGIAGHWIRLDNGLGVAIGLGKGRLIVDAVVLGVAAGLSILDAPAEVKTSCMLSFGGGARDRFCGGKGGLWTGVATMPGARG